MLDWIHSPRSTTTAGACSGSASRPVSARTGSRASWASSRNSATTPCASVGVVAGPLGMNRSPICSARVQSTRFATSGSIGALAAPVQGAARVAARRSGGRAVAGDEGGGGPVERRTRSQGPARGRSVHEGERQEATVGPAGIPDERPHSGQRAGLGAHHPARGPLIRAGGTSRPATPSPRPPEDPSGSTRTRRRSPPAGRSGWRGPAGCAARARMRRRTGRRSHRRPTHRARAAARSATPAKLAGSPLADAARRPRISA